MTHGDHLEVDTQWLRSSPTNDDVPEGEREGAAGLNVVLVQVEHTTNLVRLVRSDAKQATVPLERPMPIPRLVTTSYVPGQPGMVFGTDDGTHIWVETLPAEPKTDPDPRLVVYLDQNHWSSLSKCLYSPQGQSQDLLDATRQLVEWTQEGKVRLPMSSGHLLESTHWTNRVGRENLALTLMRLSRGWQMRHPQDIRLRELRALFTNQPPTGAEDVFTLAPAALHHELAGVTPKAPASIPADAAGQYESLTAWSSIASTLLDPDPIERVTGHRWTTVQQQVSATVDASTGTRPQKLHFVDQVLLADLGLMIGEVAAAASMPFDLSAALVDPQAWEGFSDCRGFMVYRAAVAAKHLDFGSKWEDNDLIDLTYLCPAGAYADAVACERKTASLLRRVLPSLGISTAVHFKLPDLVEDLRHRLAGIPEPVTPAGTDEAPSTLPV
jgi:hypothetical protein